MSTYGNDLASALILLALALAIIGALRFDLLALIWRECLKLGGQARITPAGDSAHGPYRGRFGMTPRRIAAVNKPAFHRSGRRG
jgi:hypothetical protein